MGTIPLRGCSVSNAEEKMKKPFCFEVSTRFRFAKNFLVVGSGNQKFSNLFLSTEIFICLLIIELK